MAHRRHTAKALLAALAVSVLMGAAVLALMQNYAGAVKWFRSYAMVQNSLGFMYETGQGVPQDYAEAVKWYRLAAEQGTGRIYRQLPR